MVASCDARDTTVPRSTFCGTWLELTKSGRDAALERQIPGADLSSRSQRECRHSERFAMTSKTSSNAYS